VFNIGLRVDRLDLNQSVLKDQYVLFPTVKAGESEAQNLASNMEGNYSIPGNVGSDYVVYVDDVDDPTRILGYRDDEQWFDSQGSPIQDPSTLTVNGVTQPYMVFGSDFNKNISTAFEDYKPQVNVMPRIAFSFPISDVALFFAHYDVLTQRPPTGNRFEPVDYLFMADRVGATLNNPDLKPEKTVDYEELGDDEKLAIKRAIHLGANLLLKISPTLAKDFLNHESTFIKFGGVAENLCGGFSEILRKKPKTLSTAGNC